jgi:hypothetical protein
MTALQLCSVNVDQHAEIRKRIAGDVRQGHPPKPLGNKNLPVGLSSAIALGDIDERETNDWE